VSFSRLFLEWTCISGIFSDGIVALFGFESSPAWAIIACLFIYLFMAVPIGLFGAAVLTNSRPRPLHERRRFVRIVGLFLPIGIFFILPICLSALGMERTFGRYGLWSIWIYSSPLIIGSVLGGDWAARRMEGFPLRKVSAFFSRS
jgi:hypothetical protein